VDDRRWPIHDQGKMTSVDETTRTEVTGTPSRRQRSNTYARSDGLRSSKWFRLSTGPFFDVRGLLAVNSTIASMAEGMIGYAVTHSIDVTTMSQPIHGVVPRQFKIPVSRTAGPKRKDAHLHRRRRRRHASWYPRECTQHTVSEIRLRADTIEDVNAATEPASQTLTCQRDHVVV
jgi:hypothetical protein